MGVENFRDYAVFYLKDRYPRTIAKLLGCCIEDFRDKINNHGQFDTCMLNALLTETAAYYDTNKIRINSLSSEKKKTLIKNYIKYAITQHSSRKVQRHGAH